MITCCDIPSFLNSFPPKWKKELSALLCQLIDNNKAVSCDAVKNCETLTILSDINLDVNNILSLTYYDEEGTANFRSIDLSGITTPSINYVFNNGLTGGSGVVKLGGFLLNQTTISVVPDTFMRFVNAFGYFSIDPTQTTLNNLNIQFPYFTNASDNSESVAPLNFLYTDVNGYLQSGSIDYILNQIPIIPLYTSSQGVSKTGFDFKFGDTAVAGTALSANPLTTDRDITGNQRISFKNKRVYFGDNNAEDDLTTKVKIVADADQQYAFRVINKAILINRDTFSCRNDGIVTIGNSASPFGTFLAFVGESAPVGLNKYSINYFTSGVKTPFYITPSNQDIPIVFNEGFNCVPTKYTFTNVVNFTSSERQATHLIECNLTKMLETVPNPVHNISEIKAVTSDRSGSSQPLINALNFSGNYIMSTNFNNRFTFIKVEASYDKSTLAPISGVGLVRFIHYAPTINSPAINQQEIGLHLERGGGIFNNGTGVDTLRIPSLTTSQRNSVIPLSLLEFPETTNVGKIVYNSDNKNIEFHNGLGWVNNRPITLAIVSGSTTWNGYNQNATITLTTNTTLNLASLGVGSTLILTCIQDATGSRTLTPLAAGYTIVTSGTLSTTPNARNIISYYVDSLNVGFPATSIIYQTISQQYV